jgi:hypothetical protein
LEHTAIHQAVTTAAHNKRQPRLPQVRYLEHTAIHLAVTTAACNKEDSLACLRYGTWSILTFTWLSRLPPATRRTASPASGTVPGPYRHPPGSHSRHPQQGRQPRMPQVRYLEHTAIHLAVMAASRNKEDSLACLRYGTWSIRPFTWPSQPPPATRRTASLASGTVLGAYHHPPGRHSRCLQQGEQPRLPQVGYLEHKAIHLAVTAATRNNEDSLACLRYGTWSILPFTWPSRLLPATRRTASPAQVRYLEHTAIHLAVTAATHNKVDSLACLRYSAWAVPLFTWPSRPPPATRKTASPASDTVPGPHRHPPGRHGRRPQQGRQPRLPQIQYLGHNAIHLAVTAASCNKEDSLVCSGAVLGAYRHSPGRHDRHPHQGRQPCLPQVQCLGRTAIHLAVMAAARNKEESLACLRYSTWAVPPSTWPSRPLPATRRTASPALGTVPEVKRGSPGHHSCRPQQGGQPRLPQVRYPERTAIHLAVTAATRNTKDSLASLGYGTCAVPPSTWPPRPLPHAPQQG